MRRRPSAPHFKTRVSLMRMILQVTALATALVLPTALARAGERADSTYPDQRQDQDRGQQQRRRLPVAEGPEVQCGAATADAAPRP